MEQNLLSFYEQYGPYRLDGSNSDQSENGNLELRFLNFSDREYWVIQVNTFVLTRNVQRPLLYQYDIQMTGLKRFGGDDQGAEKAIQNYLDYLDASSASAAAASLSTWADIVNTVKNGYEAITSTITELETTMNTISEAVSNFSNGVTSLVNLPASIITTAISMANSVMSAIESIENAPHELIDSVRNVQRELYGMKNNASLFQQSTTTISITGSNTASSTSTSTEVMTVELPSKLYADGTVVRMNIPEETIFSSDIESTTPKTSTYRSITDSDTIYSIAQATGADWKAIATLNDIEYPYIGDDKFTEELSATLTPYAIPAGTTMLPFSFSPAPIPGSVLQFPDGSTSTVRSATDNSVTLDGELGVSLEALERVSNHAKVLSILKPGDKILIPADSRGGDSGVSVDSEDSLEIKLFGIDEYLDENGDIVSSPGMDITTVSGMSNLEMQLQHRIVTLRGELAELGHADYGSLVPLLIGEMNTDTTQERIPLECINTVASDPRVRNVTNATLTEDGATFYFEATVQPINELPSTLISIPLS